MKQIINYKAQTKTKKFGFWDLFIKICLVFSISYLVFPTGISAQSRIPLVVAPARQTVAIDAGKTENLQIKFFNESTTPISGNIKVVDFIVTKDDGSPTLLEDQVNTWVKLPFDRASIASGDVLKINFKVTVPEDTPPGGRYFAVIFEQIGQLPESNSDNEQAMAISPRIIGLVNVRINGEVNELAFINNFKIPVFLQFGPVPVSFEILNKGGYHITPRGQIVLKNWFGNKVSQSILETKNIFPNAKREYQQNLEGKWMFGKYSVFLTAGYGDSGKVLTTSAGLWIIPVYPIIAITLIIIITVMIIIMFYKKLKAKQTRLEEKLEEEISEIEELKNKFKDNPSK